jgi:hypothetical protein
VEDLPIAKDKNQQQIHQKGRGQKMDVLNRGGFGLKMQWPI